MRDFVTKRRYTCATIFIDHFSDLSYIHIQTSLTVEDTILAKRLFQAYARNHGVTIKHYHADNGRFADKLFLSAIEQDKQTISFCAVYDHFQNSKVEKRIWDLQDRTRRVLLHSVDRWPTVSSNYIWPFVLHHVNNTERNMPKYVHSSSPLEIFSGSQVSPRLSSYHTFGYPVYALNNKKIHYKMGPKVPVRTLPRKFSTNHQVRFFSS